MGNYLGLVLGIIGLLASLVLSFSALTIIWRRQWETFGATESLLARLSASVVVGLLAMAGNQYLFYAIQAVLQPDRATSGPPDQTVGRNQALAVVAIGLALTVIAVLRIELYHRRAIGISHRGESEEEWQTEEPEEKRAPRKR